MRPHYRGFVPTVIRNHKRHHSSHEYEGEDETLGEAGVGGGGGCDSRQEDLIWKRDLSSSNL